MTIDTVALLSRSLLRGPIVAPKVYARRVPFEGALSPLHWAIVGLVAFLVLGPERLPETARRLGQALRKLREVESQVRGEVSQLVDRDGE